MKKEHAFPLAARSSAFGLGIVLMVCAPAVLAQEPKPAAPAVQSHSLAAPANAQAPAAAMPQDQEAAAEEEEEDFGYEPLQVGDATQGLLALQRSAEAASATPRPIAGSVAHRSYERYLKSFEFPIPERMSSSVKSSSGSGNGANAPR